MTTTIQTQVEIHPFQRTLGDGPYTFVGTFDLGSIVAALQAGNVDAYNNGLAMAPRLEAGMGTCAHCCHAISFICVVKTGDGKLYGVGSDCIAKVGLPVKELTKLEKQLRDRAKAKRAAARVAKGNKARNEVSSLILTHGDAMKAIHHPSSRKDIPMENGRSLLSYAEWVVEHSNDGGIVFALKRIQDALDKAKL